MTGGLSHVQPAIACPICAGMPYVWDAALTPCTDMLPRRKGMDLYFKRHDGQAVTCDDFRNAMADANGQDLADFAAW